MYFNWTCINKKGGKRLQRIILPSENTDHKHVKASVNSSKDRFPPKTNKSRFGNPESRNNGDGKIRISCF